MEDQSQVEAGQKATIVGVYDGHGGPQSSKYLCGKLLDYLLKLVVVMTLFTMMPVAGAEEVAGWQLVYQWPQTFCYSQAGLNCIQYIPENFLIHGLWAHNINLLPIKCPQLHPPSQLPVLTNKVLVDELHTIWINMIKNQNLNFEQNNMKFWEYEWRQHGECNSLTWRQYVQKVGTLHDILGRKFGNNFNQFLKWKGYKPGTKEHDPITILKDIEKQTTLEAEMTCLTHQPGRLIWEIRFCLDKRGGAFVNCNKPKQYNTYNCATTKLKGIIFPKSTSIPPPPPPKSPPPPPPKSRSPPSNVSTSTSRIPSTSTSN